MMTINTVKMTSKLSTRSISPSLAHSHENFFELKIIRLCKQKNYLKVFFIFLATKIGSESDPKNFERHDKYALGCNNA